MTMAALRHPSHTVDAFSRTTGPHRVAQACLHTPRGTLPLGPQSLTQHWLADDQLTSTPAGVTLSLWHLVVDVPQTWSSLSQHWFRDGRSQVVTQPSHMTQRPLLAQQALAFAPTVAVKPLARFVELCLSGLTAIALPLGIQPCQSGGKLRHRLLGMPRLLDAPLCLAPGAPSDTRDSARITPLPLLPSNRGIGLTRRVALPRGVFPLTREDAFAFTWGVQHGKAPRSGLLGDGLGRLALRASGGMRQLHPALTPLAPIGDDVLQTRPGGDHRAPPFPAAIWSPLARPPGHAVWLDRHQHRRAMQEDCVEAEHLHARQPG
jgi:hypothetical protein